MAQLEDRTARIEAYAEALAFFIDQPEAVADTGLKAVIDFFKERIAQELDRRAKGMGTQKVLESSRC
jgi:hypothetical protein